MSRRGGILTEFGKRDESRERFQGAVRTCGRRHFQPRQLPQLGSYSRLNEGDWSLGVRALTRTVRLNSGWRENGWKIGKALFGMTPLEFLECGKRQEKADRALLAGKKERKFLT